MVSDVNQVQRVREILESLELDDMPALGAMIEIPAAVTQIEDILRVSDFVNIGTNDLVQYTLAVDRDNDSVADYFQTLHPAILRSLRSVFDAAARAGKEAVVCGEMAGSPFYIPVLIGLGGRVFSMNPHKTEEIASIVAAVDSGVCTELANQLLELSKPDDVEAKVNTFYKEYLNDLLNGFIN